MAADDSYEQDLFEEGFKYIAGIDESGAGCFSGAVMVAAVIFPQDIDYTKLLPGLNDSKKKTPAQREVLYDLIKEHALSYCIASASVEEIDELNIYWAKFLAARRAISGLAIDPDYVLMDGNKEIPEIDVDQSAIVKGDAKSISIAAASILAKVDRDAEIVRLSKLVHSDYEWAKNKSYYSPEHVAAIKKHGKTIYHREKYVAKYFE